MKRPNIITSLIINPDELSKRWIDILCEKGYTILSIHPKAGKLGAKYMRELANIQDDPNYRKLIDYAISKGLKIEYECHALGYLMPRELFDIHPEYFRMNSDGVRTNDYNFCISNDEALNLVKNNAKELAKKLYKSEHTFYFWLDDVKEESTCMCEKCRKYTESDKNIIVMNALSDALREVYDDSKVAYLAYQKTINPPAHVKPNDNVFLEYAPIERDMKLEYEKQGKENIDNIKELISFFGKRNSKVLEYWVDNSLFSSWTKPPLKYECDDDVLEKDIDLYLKLGFERISSFACYLGDDYVELYGNPVIPSFKKIIDRKD